MTVNFTTFCISILRIRLVGLNNYFYDVFLQILFFISILMLRIRLVSIMSIVSSCCSKKQPQKGYTEMLGFFYLGTVPGRSLLHYFYSWYLRNLDDLLKSHKIMQFKALFTMVYLPHFSVKSNFYEKIFIQKEWQKQFHWQRNIGYSIVFPYSVTVKIFFIYIGTCPIFVN